jgi:hypothetical protein
MSVEEFDANEKPTSDGGNSELANAAVRLRLKNVENSVNDIDMFGNVRLHQMFAHRHPDYQTISVILQLHPDSPRMRNQFGRIPLHYCVDRTTVDLPCFRLLLDAYPLGASVEDDTGMTPYDLARKWRQPKVILKALLTADPSQDWPELIKLRWGPLAPFVSCILDPTSSRQSRSASRVAVLGEEEIPSADERNPEGSDSNSIGTSMQGAQSNANDGAEDDPSPTSNGGRRSNYQPTTAWSSSGSTWLAGTGSGSGDTGTGSGLRLLSSITGIVGGAGGANRTRSGNGLSSSNFDRPRHPDEVREFDEERENGLLVTLATVVSKSDPRMAVNDEHTLHPDPGIMDD